MVVFEPFVGQIWTILVSFGAYGKGKCKRGQRERRHFLLLELEQQSRVIWAEKELKLVLACFRVSDWSK